MQPLEDYQRSFNDLVIGAGTPYEIMEEAGLEGYRVRSGTRDLPREDGGIPGLHLVDSKTVLIPIEIVGDPDTEIPQRINAALKAFTPQEHNLFRYRFKNPGDDERFVWARPLRFERSRTVTGTFGLEAIQVALELPDPRIYSAERFLEEVPEFTAAGGGTDFPLNFPFNMDAAPQELAEAINQGSRAAYPRVLFQHVSGTVSGVKLTNLTNGDVLEIVTDIVGEQQLVADMDIFIRATGGSVVTINGSSRYGNWQLPRDPFKLSPGANTLKLETTGGGTVECSVSWRHTN